MRARVRDLISSGTGLVLWMAAAAAQPQPPPEAIFRHAIELHQAGDLEGAIRGYRDYLKQVPDNFMARSNLGAALSRVEGQVAINALLKRMPHLKIEATEPLQWKTGSTIRTLGRIVGSGVRATIHR